MKISPNSLLARARAYTQGGASRAVLTVAPLAALGLAADSAQAVAAGPVLNPSGTVTYPGDSAGAGAFNTGSGTIAGSALAIGSNGLTGAKYQGSAGFTEMEAGRSGLMGSILAFNITGTGSGTLNAGDSSIPLHYNFTLGTTATANDVISVTGWTLTLSITSSTGTGTQTVSNSTGGVGVFSGTTAVTVPGAATGATLTGYAGSLTVNYTNTGAGNGGTLSVTVPANSVDFNAIPEPTSWMILSAGVVGAGLYVMRVRSQRPQSAPSI